MTRRLKALVLFSLVGCGRSELPAECRAGLRSGADLEPMAACVVDAAACVPDGEAAVVTTRATAAPSVAFAGDEILTLAFDACGAQLTATTRYGGARWSRRLGMETGGHLAFHQDRGEGLAVAGAAMWRLAADGRPSPDRIELGAPAGDAFATRDGLGIVFSGAFGRLLDGTLERLPFEATGAAAIHHAEDAGGKVRFFTTSSEALWDLAGGEPARRDDVFDTWGRVVAAAEMGGEVFTLSVIEDEELAKPVLWLKSWGLTAGGGRGDVFVQTPGVESTHAALLAVGDALVTVTPHIHGDDHLAFAIIDVSTQPETLGEVTPLTDAARAIVHGIDATPTPRGFAAAWVEREPEGGVATTRVQHVSCCAR